MSGGYHYTFKEVVAEDRPGDLALAAVVIRKGKVAPGVEYLGPISLRISATMPEVGERVAVIGSPMGLEQTLSEGVVSAVRKIPDFGEILQITAPISPGSSGSPVVNMKGEVIGVATLQLVKGQNLNFAVPGNRALALQQKAVKLPDAPTQPPVAETRPVPAIRYQDDLAKAFLEQGNEFLKAENYEKAATAFTQAIRLQPKLVEAHSGLGKSFQRLGRFPEAMEAYKEAIRLKPDLAEAHFGIGGVFLGLNRYKEAVEAFKQVIRLKPNDAEAYECLGSAFKKLGRRQEAIETYEQWIRLAPDRFEAYCRLASALSSLGRLQEAAEAYKQAIRLKPNDARTHFWLGLIYIDMGNRNAALEEYKILKALDEKWANLLFDFIYR
jgi:tetratricopeptide (TPR) repeat protein